MPLLLPRLLAFALLALLLGCSAATNDAPAGNGTPTSENASGTPADGATTNGTPTPSTGPSGSPVPAPGETASAEPGVVIGRVYQYDQPKPKTLIQLKGPGDVLLQETTDDLGEFTISDVPPGEYLLNVVDYPAVKAGVLAIKTRGITVEPGGLVDEEFVFGLGIRVHGTIAGLPLPTGRYQIALYRPGAPKLAGTPLSDQELQVELAKFLAGSAYIEGATSYEVFDVEPGTYRIELTQPPATTTPRHEPWPRPLYESQITIGEQDVEWSIDLTRDGG